MSKEPSQEPTKPDGEEPKKKGLFGIFGTAKEVMYGMPTHDMSRSALRTRASMEHLFILITMVDVLDVPTLQPYSALRLMPIGLPQTSPCCRRRPPARG